MLLVGRPILDITLEPNPIPGGHEPNKPATGRMDNSGRGKAASFRLRKLFNKKHRAFSMSLKHGTTIKMGLAHVSLMKILFLVLKLATGAWEVSYPPPFPEDQNRRRAYFQR